MTVGLGSGSTSLCAVDILAERIKKRGFSIIGVVTSRQTQAAAKQGQIPIRAPEDIEKIDVTIDGADEIDGGMRAIKGGGRCLLWEKIIAHASVRMVVMVDEGKVVKTLGAFPLPIEVIPFGFTITCKAIDALIRAHGYPNARLVRRDQDKTPVLTDSGHWLVDVHGLRLDDPEPLALALNQVPGVVETGLFVSEVDAVVVGRDNGDSQIKTRDA